MTYLSRLRAMYPLFCILLIGLLAVVVIRFVPWPERDFADFAEAPLALLPTPMLLAETPLPLVRSALTADSIQQIVPLARWGNGQPQAANFARDGRLAVGDAVGITIFAPDSFTPVGFIPTPASAVNIQFAPDGATIAAILLDGSTRLWDLATGQQRMVAAGPIAWHGSALVFSPDGKLLASGAVRTLRLWQVDDGSLVATLVGHESTISQIVFSVDGQTLVSADAGITGAEMNTPMHVLIWDVASAQLRADLAGPSRVERVLLEDSQTLVTLIRSVVEVYTIQSSGLLLQSALVIPRLDSVAFRELLLIPGVPEVLITFEDGVIERWSLTGQQQPLDVQPNIHNELLAANPTGTQALLIVGDTLQLQRTTDGTLLAQNLSHSGTLDAMALSADGAVIALGSTNGIIQLRSTRDGQILGTLDGQAAVSSVALSADGAQLAVGAAFSADDPGYQTLAVRLWNTTDGVVLHSYAGHTYTIESLALSPDGRLLAASSLDQSVRLWNVADARLERVLADNAWVDRLMFTPDGRYLIGAIKNQPGVVQIWPIGSAEPARTLGAPAGDSLYQEIAISPAGDLVAIGSDSRVQLWRWDGHTPGRFAIPGRVQALAFSPDGQVIAVTSDQGGVTFWRVDTRMQVGAIPARNADPILATFLPDQSAVLVGYRDGIVEVWARR